MNHARLSGYAKFIMSVAIVIFTSAFTVMFSHAQTCRTPDGRTAFVFEPAAEDIGDCSQPVRVVAQHQHYTVNAYVDETFGLSPQATFQRLVDAVRNGDIGILHLNTHANPGLFTIEFYDDTPVGMASRDAALQAYETSGYHGLQAGHDHGAYYIRVPSVVLDGVCSDADSHTDGALVYVNACESAGFRDSWHALASLGYDATISGLAGEDVFCQRMDGTRDRGPANSRRSAHDAGGGIAHLVGYVGEDVVLSPVVLDHYPESFDLVGEGDAGFVEFDCEMDTSVPPAQVVTILGTIGGLANVTWANNHRIEFQVQDLEEMAAINFRVHADKAISAHNGAQLDGNANPANSDGVGPNEDFYGWTSYTSYYAMMDFEDGIDGQPIRSTIPGMEFITTQGYDWIYGDKTTNQYNIYPYNGAMYWCNGNNFAWLGPNQGSGRINFTGATATSIYMGTSCNSGLHVDAYDGNNNLLDSDFAGGNLNTNTLSQLRVTGAGIDHVIVHDTGNYWLVDDLIVVDLLQQTLILLPENYAEILNDLHEFAPGITESFIATVGDIAANLQVIINWLGSEMQLTLYDPNGKVFGEFQTTTPPIIVDVPNPLPGNWVVKVTAVDIPHDGYPVAIVAATESEPVVDCYIEASDIWFEPENPEPGDLVDIFAAIHDGPTSAEAVEYVRARCYLGDPHSGGTQIEADEYALDLVPGGVDTVYFHLDTAGMSGSVSIYVDVDPLDELRESDEGNNTANNSFHLGGQIVNVPPSIACQAPDTSECAGLGTNVTLSAEVTDENGDSLTVTWQVNGGVAETDRVPQGEPTTEATVSFTYPYPLGQHTVLAVVDDGVSSDSCETSITIVDTTPPQISVDLNRDVLWPPNHKMVDVSATVTVTDACCAAPTFKLISVTSNEPDNGKGDGNTVDDIQGADPGTADVAFELRSERSGKEDGRIYTIVYEAEDCLGHTAFDTVAVRVPHDHSGMALASLGYMADGSVLDRSVERFVLIIPSTAAQFGVDEKGNSVVIAEPFDATKLDATTIYVGNTGGAIKPLRSLKVDNNGDGLVDLALFYSSEGAVELVRNSSTISGDALEIDGEGVDGPVGLHYTDVRGMDYLVRDIFALGTPVPLDLPTDKKRNPYEQGLASSQEQPVTQRVNALLPSYPNPFNPTTTIPFELAAQGRVSLRIFDTQGKLVRTLCDEVIPAGIHQAVWDGRDNVSRQVATGVYFVRLVTGDYQMTRKLVMIK